MDLFCTRAIISVCGVNALRTQPLRTNMVRINLVPSVNVNNFDYNNRNEPPRDKTNKMTVRPAKTQIRPVWSESSLCAQWIAKDHSFLHTESEDSDQTGRMPRLTRVFAGRKLILLVLSSRGSFTTKTWLSISQCKLPYQIIQTVTVVELKKLFSAHYLLWKREYFEREKW